LVVVAICFGVSYYWLGTAKVAVKVHTTSMIYGDLGNATTSCSNPAQCQSVKSTISLLLSPVLYATALIIIIGYLSFICCGGIGMASFPLSFIKRFIFRNSKRINFEEWTRVQETTLQKTTKLLEYGKKINEKANFFVDLKTRNLMRVFEDVVTQEDENYKKSKKSYEKGGDGLIIPLCCLGCGICIGCVSFIWIIHIIINMILPTGFTLLGLSFFMIYINGFLPPFAWGIYLFFTYYLLACVVVGNVRVFSRIPILKNIFPLTYKDTMLNSFMINANLLLLSSLAIIQFTTTAFRDYLNGTAIYGFFSFVNNMFIIGYFFQYVHYAVFVFCFFGIVIGIIDIIIDLFGLCRKIDPSLKNSLKPLSDKLDKKFARSE